MSKAGMGMLEQGTQAPSPAPDLIPAESKNQPRTDTEIGAANGGTSVQPKNAEAYNSYLQGRYFYERTGRENLEKAAEYCEQAIKHDPSFALAWAELALVRYEQTEDFGYLPLEQGIRKSRDAAERALALDPNLAEAYAAMGMIQTAYDWDWGGAETSFRRALARDPGNVIAATGAAWLAVSLNRLEEALVFDRRAVALDPLNANSHTNLGLHAYYAGKQEEAVAALKKALELNPDSPPAHWGIGMVRLKQGRAQEALAEVEQEKTLCMRLQGLALAYHALGRKQDSNGVLEELITKCQLSSAFQIAEVYAFRGEADPAFEWLERAYAQRDGGLTLMKRDPLLKDLEHDPRFIAFLKKMRLPLN